MNATEYRTETAARLIGRRYMLARTIRNSYVELPAGTIVEITGKRSGLNVKADPCPACGLRAIVNRVQPGDLGPEVRA